MSKNQLTTMVIAPNNVGDAHSSDRRCIKRTSVESCYNANIVSLNNNISV